MVDKHFSSSNIFVMFWHGGCASKSAHPISTNSQVLTERALSLVDDIIVFKNSVKFYPIVITEVTITCGFSLFWSQIYKKKIL